MNSPWASRKDHSHIEHLDFSLLRPYPIFYVQCNTANKFMHWWKTAASSNFLKHQTTTKEQSNNKKATKLSWLRKGSQQAGVSLAFYAIVTASQPKMKNHIVKSSQSMALITGWSNEICFLDTSVVRRKISCHCLFYDLCSLLFSSFPFTILVYQKNYLISHLSPHVDEEKKVFFLVTAHHFFIVAD